MAGRGKRGYQSREFRNTNRRVNSSHRIRDLPSTSRKQSRDEWDDDLPETTKTPFLDVEPGFEQHQAWRDELLAAWNKNNDFFMTSQLLKVSFRASSNPYRTALYFMSESPDLKSGKPNTLCSTVMKSFQDWLKEDGNLKSLAEKCEISRELRVDAFEAASSQNNSSLTQMVVEIYGLGDVGDDFVERVKLMVKFGEYKQACLFASLLNIQKYFNINEFLVPLLLQDRVNFVQNYLDKYPAQREQFVQFLDDMCTYDKNAYQLASALEIADARPEKWNPRAFKKLGSRFMKLYNISPDVCSNISQINNFGTLKYLIQKKYADRSIGDEAWAEMIESVVNDDVGLQVELCGQLMWYDDLPCAVKWAQKYNIPKDRIHNDTLIAALEGREVTNYGCADDESWDDYPVYCYQDNQDNYDDQSFHLLSLPTSAIVCVSDKKGFQCMLDVLQVSNVIGCDCEWKPGTATKLSIIQLATWDQIFIIDVKVILDYAESAETKSDVVVDAHDWRSLIMAVFANPDIKKLGFGFSTDLKMLSQSLPECQTLHSDTKNFTDLHGLSQKIGMMKPEIFPYSSTHNTRGLSDIVQMCFGKKLDKREQFSNWDNRPLRQQQIEYAAMDAFCLLEVYIVLQSRAAELGVDLEAMSGPQGKRNKRKSPQSKSNQEPNASFECCPCKPSDFRVVVDSMLDGLGRQLRLMGVDVKTVENASEHEAALRIGINERRVILTSGGPFKKISQYVEPGMCHYVNIALPQREQALEVLNFYKIQVTTEDIFSRCPKCNNSRYIKIDSETAKNLWQNSLVLSFPSPFRTALWKLFDGGKIDTLNVKTDENSSLQFDGVSDELFSRVNLFYVCATCGKVYWEGSHLKRIVSTLKNLVVDD